MFELFFSTTIEEYLYGLDEVIITDDTEIFNLDLNFDNSQETIGNLSKGICKEEIVETSKHHDPEKKEPIDAPEENDTQRSEILEYMIKGDGGVICKLCGEVLQSRSEWYRHKYKLHVVHQPLNALPIYQCEQCLVFFKTKKGYIGHMESRHNVTLLDTHPPLNIVPVDITSNETIREMNNASRMQKKHYNLDILISKKAVPNQNASRNEKKKCRPKVEPLLTDEEIEERRSREERLVADIINRVKKECDAQGASTRRGYTKRSTVMNIQ